MEIIDRLNTFAESIKSNSAAYATASEASESLTKTAQYVGSQGYWIANSRCWSNCYRQKRSSSPSMTAQDVWTECQEEYQKHVESGSDEWFKYAGSKDEIKTSSVANRHLSTQLKLKLATGTDVQVAIAESITDGASRMQFELLTASVKMAKIASELDNNKAQEAAELSAELLKEAGLWDGIQNVWQGVKNKGVGGVIQDGVGGLATSGKITRVKDQIDAQWQAIAQAVPKLNQSIQEAVVYFQEKAKSPNANTKSLASQAIGILNQAKNLSIKPAIMQQMDNVRIQLANIIAEVEKTPAAAPGAAAPGAGAAGTSPAASPLATVNDKISRVPPAMQDSLRQELQQWVAQAMPTTASNIFSLKTAQVSPPPVRNRTRKPRAVAPVGQPAAAAPAAAAPGAPAPVVPPVAPVAPMNRTVGPNAPLSTTPLQPGPRFKPKNVSVDNMGVPSANPLSMPGVGKPQPDVNPAVGSPASPAAAPNKPVDIDELLGMKPTQPASPSSTVNPADGDNSTYDLAPSTAPKSTPITNKPSTGPETLYDLAPKPATAVPATPVPAIPVPESGPYDLKPTPGATSAPGAAPSGSTYDLKPGSPKAPVQDINTIVSKLPEGVRNTILQRFIKRIDEVLSQGQKTVAKTLYSLSKRS
jgi:hypothetical protein